MISLLGHYNTIKEDTVTGLLDNAARGTNFIKMIKYFRSLFRTVYTGL
jgi:hypothetical protein